MNTQDYVNYFEGLALSSTDIDHDGNEQKGFFMIEWEEFLSSVQSGIHVPSDDGNTVMYVVMYNWGYSPNTSNLLKDYDAGYIILKQVREQNDFQAIAAALGDAEDIVHQINLRILIDSRDGHPLFTDEVNMSTFKVSPILRQHPNYYGFLVQFDMKNFIGTCLDQTKWDDL